MELKYCKNIPFKGRYDVAVFGGGPSGVCAAVEAARNGAKVLLVESTGMLGGMATSGLVGPFMTSYDKEGNRPVVGGIYREIVDRLIKLGGAIDPQDTDSPSVYTSFIKRYHKHVTPIDAFLLQIVLDEITEEAGVEVLLYSRFADVTVENGRIINAILLELQGFSYIEASHYIDCTGNADVAYAAGVETWLGEDVSHVPQPATLMFEVNGASDSEYREFNQRPIDRVKAYLMPTPGRYKVNHYHVYNVDATNSESMSKAHKEARPQVLKAYSVLRDQTPGFQNSEISSVASVLGVRESRHIEGVYKLTTEDLQFGVKFDDRICAHAFGMDVHVRSAAEHGNFKVPTADVYYVPYRSLIPLKIDNLLVGGKTISCQSQAAGAIRVMPCAMAIGQACGASASLSLKHNTDMKDVNVAELQEILRSHGAILD